MLLVLSSLLGAPGGIPSFNRLLCRSAAEFAVSTGQRLHVLALTDQPDAEPDFVDSLPQTTQRPTYHALAGDKVGFATSVLRHIGRERLVVLGHVNLSPLGLPFGRFGVIAHGTDVWTALPRYRRWALRQAHVAAGVSEHTLAQLCQVQGVFVGHCQRLVNALDEPTSWAEGPAPGLTMMLVGAGPKWDGFLTVVVRLEPGAQLPMHTHGSREQVLVLEGGYRDDQSGREFWRGDLDVREPGTSHSFTAVEGPACLCASVVKLAEDA